MTHLSIVYIIGVQFSFQYQRFQKTMVGWLTYSLLAFTFSNFCLFVFRNSGFLGGLLFEQIIISNLFTLSILLYLNQNAWKIRRTIFLNNILSTSSILLVIILVFQIQTLTLINIDRSRSFYIIAWIHDSRIEATAKGISLDQVLSIERLNTKAIEDRVDEQVLRKLVVEKQGKFQLTWRGVLLFNISEALAKMFKLNGWKNNST